MTDDDDLDDLLLGEDDWEDEQALAEILAQMPNGWFQVKIERFTQQMIRDIDEWLASQCQHGTKRVGWYSNCAYMVAVQFEDATEAIFFKLRWGS